MADRDVPEAGPVSKGLFAVGVCAVAVGHLVGGRDRDAGDDEGRTALEAGHAE